MKKLILMRHAKSDWSDDGLEDHDRPLNERGERDAPRMGRFLRGEGLTPDRVACSTATRAMRTVELLAPEAGVDTESIVFDRGLYLATPMQILSITAARAREAGDPATLMIVGHNPGMASLASMFAGESVSFPTAAIAVCALAIDAWDELGDPAEVGVRVVRPKALPDG